MGKPWVGDVMPFWATRPKHRQGSSKVRGARFAMFALAALAIFGGPSPALAQSPADTLFVRSAIEGSDGTVNLPVFRGRSGNQTVYYIITEASDLALATQLGVNFSPALANAAGSGGVQRVSTNTGPYTFPATVNFAPIRVVPIPNTVPPTGLQPGAVGNPGYSPLIQLPNGIILNAPHISNNSGRADRVISLNTTGLRVVMDEVDGFQGFQPVRYIVTDASTPEAAALENATYAPALANLPGRATAGLALIVDGQTGRNNVQRQGLNSALLGEGDPLNVLEFNPSQAGYSPIWESEQHRWAPDVVAAGQNVRQRDYLQVEALEAIAKFLPVPPNPPYVNCPIIARRSDALSQFFTPTFAGIRTSSGPATITPEGELVFQIILSANITNGSGAAANGVLVHAQSDFGPLTCTTGSTGSCVLVRYDSADAGPIITPVALNRATSAPGLPGIGR